MKTRNLILILLIWSLSSCNSKNSNNSETSGGQIEELTPSFPAKPSNLRISLTDAPLKSFSEVHVNIKHFELWLEGSGGQQGRFIFSQGLGDVDLLTLQNGNLLSLTDVDLPEGALIKSIRIILEDTGHWGKKTDDSQCDLKTPSAQKSGLKINFTHPVEVSANTSYSLIVDFDASKSVVALGNGDCLLKPVLKVPSFVSVPIDSVNEEGGETQDPDLDIPVIDDVPTNIGSGDSDEEGFDSSDPTTWPEELTEEELLLL